MSARTRKRRNGRRSTNTNLRTESLERRELLAGDMDLGLVPESNNERAADTAPHQVTPMMGLLGSVPSAESSDLEPRPEQADELFAEFGQAEIGGLNLSVQF